MTTAISDVETAYTDAAGRAADHLNINAGLISGTTFLAGVYEWDTDPAFSTDIYIIGSATDIL